MEITGPGVTEGSEDFFGGAPVSIGYSGPVVPGKVRVVIDHGTHTLASQMALAPGSVQAFIDKGNWDASVRELWEK